MFYVNRQINVVEFGNRCHFSAFLLHPPPTRWAENAKLASTVPHARQGVNNTAPVSSWQTAQQCS